MSLRNYTNNAVQTELSSAVSAADVTLSVAGVTGFPASVPYILAVDAGAATQELVLVTGVAGTTLTVTRGYDNTLAQSHEVGAKVQHAHAAIDFREANAHVNDTSGVHGATGAVVGTSDAQELTNKTLGATNIINGLTADRVLVSDGTGQLVASGTALDGLTTDAEHTALEGRVTTAESDITDLELDLATVQAQGMWQSHVPTMSWTLGNGTLTGRWTEIGKTVHFRTVLTLGSTSSPVDSLTVSLPVSAFDFVENQSFGSARLRDNSTGDFRWWASRQAGLTAVGVGNPSGGLLLANSPWTWANGDSVVIEGTYERA